MSLKRLGWAARGALGVMQRGIFNARAKMTIKSQT
jgi:hypothetical protein